MTCPSVLRNGEVEPCHAACGFERAPFVSARLSPHPYFHPRPYKSFTKWSAFPTGRSQDASSFDSRAQLIYRKFCQLDTLHFISAGFVPMNERCEHAGMSERQIFDRTKAVFESFKLAFDEEAPI